MKNKKLQAFILIFMLMLSGALDSCKKDDEFMNEQRRQKRLSSINKRQMDIYYKHIFDSIYNGDLKKIQEKIGGKLPNQTRPVYQDEAEYIMFQNNSSLSGTMDNEILLSGQNILDKYYQQLISELKRYNIDVSSVRHYFIATNVQDLLFIGVGEKIDNDMYQIGQYVIDNITYEINEMIGESNVENPEKVKTKVQHILTEMKQSLITNRKSIEQKYSDYYLLNEYGQMSLGLTQYDYDYTPSGSYKMLDWSNGKYLITKQSIELYAPNLSPEFFKDQNAVYKLISVAPAQWQIAKTLQNGNVILSDTFYDNQDFVRTVDVSDDQATPGDIEFSYVQIGGGLKICFNEIIRVEQRKKDWTPDLNDKNKHKADSLQSEIARKNKMDAELNRAWIRADSIARALTLQYFDAVNEK